MNLTQLLAVLLLATVPVALAQGPGGGGPGGGGPGGGGPGGGGPGGPQPPPPGAFPALPAAAVAPAQNPTTAAKAVLGKMLFWDEQMSSDNAVACGTCHREGSGGGDPRVALHPGTDGVFGTPDDKRASPGVSRSDANNDYQPDVNFEFDRQVTERATPTMINAAFFATMFWDGRATGQFIDPETGSVSIPVGGALESQAVGPPLSDVEMAHESRDWAAITAKLALVTPLKLASDLTPDIQAALAAIGDYPGLFAAAFGSTDITAERIAFAIAAYERTLISDQTPWDAYNDGNPNALTPQELNGMAIFFGPGQCDACHTAPLFSDGTFRNLGLRPVTEDEGRFDVTGNPGDRGRFKTPTLRNAGLRSRFMHQGEFATLQQVNAFYNAGGGSNALNRSPILNLIAVPPGAPQADLAAFVGNALTDPRVAQGLPPFDRPTLFSEVVVEPNPAQGAATAGSGGIVPQMMSEVPANTGNGDFKVGVSGGLGGAPAWLAVSPQFTTVNLSGLIVNVDFADPGFELYPVFLDGVGVGQGYKTLRFPISNLPGLVGLEVNAQWFVYDQGSAAGLDYAATEGARFTVF